MDGLKGFAGDFIDTIKDKISGTSDKDDSRSVSSSGIGDTIKKMSFGEMVSELSIGGQSSLPEGQSQPLPVDVLVIGAGLTGLVAAHRLLQEGENMKVAVLEATDRLGGRLLTRSLLSAGGEKDFYDLGAQWLSSNHKNLKDLVDELGLETYEQKHDGFKMLVPTDGKPLPFEGEGYSLGLIGKYDVSSFLSRLDSLRKLVPTDYPLKHNNALELDGITLEQFKRSYLWTNKGRELFDAQVMCNLGVTPRQISLLFFLYIINSCGGWHNLVEMGPGTGKELRIKGGSHRLCEILADRINRENIIMSDPVHEILQNDEEYVSVRTKRGRIFWTKRVVCTVPLKCLERIHFTPRLPIALEELARNTTSGSCLKFILTYETAFWTTAGKNGFVIKMVDQQHQLWASESDGDAELYGYMFVFDATTVNQKPALMGITYERHIREEMTPEDREEVILMRLKDCFGEEIFTRIAYSEKEWGPAAHEPSYPLSIVSTGAFAINSRYFRKPFMRVHLAGPEHATEWYGHIEGAVQSANTVVKEVIDSLHAPDEADAASCTDSDNQAPLE